MDYIKDISIEDVKNIRRKASESGMLTTAYTKAPCSRLSYRSGKWNRCSTFNNGPIVSEDYSSSVWEYSNIVYIVQTDGIDAYRFAFSDRIAEELKII